MMSSGALAGIDGSGIVYRPLSMLAKDSTAETVTGNPRSGGMPSPQCSGQ